MKKAVASLLFLSLSIICFGTTDTNYVRRFSTRFYLRTYVNTNGFNYSIVSEHSNSFSRAELKDSRVKYLSYTPISAGFAVNLFSIGFSHTFQSSVNYLNTSNKIATYLRTYTFNYYGKSIELENYFDYFKRFYFVNGRETATYLIAPENAPYTSEAFCFNMGTNLTIVFNHDRFSYKAAFCQSEFQKKSQGSFLLLLQDNINHFQHDVGLIPASLKVYYDNTASLYMNRQTSFAVSPGYAYNLVYKKFYTAAAIFAGPGLQVQRAKTGIDKYRKPGLAFFEKTKFTMGINGRKFFGGLFADINWNHSKVDTFSNNQFYDDMGVFIAFRVIHEKKK